MADFEDITGWREELEAFEKTEEGRVFFAGNKRYRGVKMPYENVVQMVDLIFADEELHEALKKRNLVDRIYRRARSGTPPGKILGTESD